MNKQKLVRFINKYYLNGIVNSVILNSNSNKLSNCALIKENNWKNFESLTAVIPTNSRPLPQPKTSNFKINSMPELSISEN